MRRRNRTVITRCSPRVRPDRRSRPAEKAGSGGPERAKGNDASLRQLGQPGAAIGPAGRRHLGRDNIGSRATHTRRPSWVRLSQNSKAGPRIVPGRVILVPDTVSPQLQAAIAAPFRVPAWFHNGLAMRKCCDSSERDARTKCTDRDCDGDDPSPDTSTPRRRRDRDFGRDR
jgi:hypothetical protein